MKLRGFIAVLTTAIVAACSFAPDYKVPEVETPAAFKENVAGWTVAKPADDMPRGPWWEIFKDPMLNDLQTRVTSANQDLKVALAQYEQARAVASVAGADLFPTITANAGASRQRNSSNTANVAGKQQYNQFSLGAGLSYEIDIWGKVRNAVAAGESRAEASKADLAAVELSLHAELAADYFALRGYDAMIKVLERTIEIDQKSLELTQNRFNGGISPETDIYQAQTLLENTRTQASEARLKRTQMENAIAVLTGQAPANFKLGTMPLDEVNVAQVNPGLPSTLLQRRPDISAAERLASAANSDIGVARAAWFPDFSITGMLGLESASPASWMTAPSRFWSLGPSAVLTLFDAGRIDALSDEARAAYDASAASYRQTVLNAYREVEDSLAALRHLNDESRSLKAATNAAARALQQERNLYTGGAATFLDVAVSENTSLQAELAEINIRMRLVAAHIQLVKALGGGWQQ